MRRTRAFPPSRRVRVDAKPRVNIDDGSIGHRSTRNPYPARWVDVAERCGRTDAAETVDGNLNLGFGDNVNVGL